MDLPIILGIFIPFIGTTLGSAMVFLLKDKLNEVVASKKFTLTENPHSKAYPFFYRAFDDEGVATSKKTIVEKGVLKTFLYNIEAAKQANTTSTGNGYGGAAIGISTSFLEVKPGKKDKDGHFPAGTINYLVYEKLKKYAQLDSKK